MPVICRRARISAHCLVCRDPVELYLYPRERITRTVSDDTSKPHLKGNIMETNLDALIKALADLVWDHIEDRVTEQVRDTIRDTDFEIDIRHSSIEIEADVTPRI